MNDELTSVLIRNGKVVLVDTQEYQQLIAERDVIRKKLEMVEDKLHEIDNWAKAYPLDIFPEPDLKRVRELLAVGGISIDVVSASNMRHVIKGIEQIVSETLAEITRI